MKDYYEQLGEIRSDHDRVSEGYLKLSERLTNKMDELAEAEDEKIRLEYENQQITKKYLEMIKRLAPEGALFPNTLLGEAASPIK